VRQCALFTCAENHAKIWNKNDWTSSHFGPSVPVTNYGASLAVSPDGSLLACSLTQLRLLDIETETVISTYDIQRRGHVWLQFSPDGSLLAAGLPRKATIKVWRVADLVGE